MIGNRRLAVGWPVMLQFKNANNCPFSSLHSTEDMAITAWGLRAPRHTFLGVLILEEWPSRQENLLIELL